MRLYPAYARPIAAHIARGQRPIAVGVLLSSQWGWLDHVPKVCIKPDEWARGRWEFGYLRGMHVVAVWGFDVAPVQFGELLLELMEAGPELIWTSDLTGDVSETYGLSDIADYARALLIGRDGGAANIELDASIAEGLYQASQGRAVRRHLAEISRIEQKRGPEAAERWRELQAAARQRVRELFSTPRLDASESQAA